MGKKKKRERMKNVEKRKYICMYVNESRFSSARKNIMVVFNRSNRRYYENNKSIKMRRVIENIIVIKVLNDKLSFDEGKINFRAI